MRVEVAAKLLHQAVKRSELRDELYMQAGQRVFPNMQAGHTSCTAPL